MPQDVVADVGVEGAFPFPYRGRRITVDGVAGALAAVAVLVVVLVVAVVVDSAASVAAADSVVVAAAPTGNEIHGTYSDVSR
jgi:hypothetical protein